MRTKWIEGQEILFTRTFTQYEAVFENLDKAEILKRKIKNSRERSGFRGETEENNYYNIREIANGFSHLLVLEKFHEELII